MNNKGFAITTILYGILILFLFLLLSMLGILSSYRSNLEKLVESNNGARDILAFNPVGYWESISSGNIDTGRMVYSMDNHIVTVTANMDDGYGFIPYRVKLVAGEKYYFKCETDGVWGSEVEAFLMLNGQYTTYYHMNANPTVFTPTVSGTYWLRLDVNNTGKTRKFWNIRVLEKA